MSNRLALVVAIVMALALCGQSLGPALARPADATVSAGAGSVVPAGIGYGTGRNRRPPPPVPTVVDYAPVGTEVSLQGTTIAVTFSVSMNKTSVKSSLSISPSVSGSVSWSGNTIRYTPSSSLKSDTTYTVTVSTTAKSADGVSLAAPVSWSFTTTAALPPPPPPPSGSLIISCVGDSITEGLYPAALQGLLGTTADVGNFGSGGTCVVINNGGVAVPYITTAVCQQAQQFMPTTVVIMLGTNDTDPDIYKYISRFVADYEQLVRQFQAVSTHPKIWLVKPPAIYGTPYGLNNTNLVNGVIPRISQVASEMGLSTIDVYSATTGHPEYFVDGVHPNSKGAAVIANVIAEAIR